MTGKSMILLLDGSPEHGAHIQSKSGISIFKAFGYIEIVVKSGEDIFYFIRA